MKKIAWIRLVRLLAGLLLVLVLAGCAAMGRALTGASAPNPYGPDGMRGGWSQTRVAADRFLVFFMGTWSDEERVSDLGMLRAAELTLEHGFSTFNVLSESLYVEGTDRGRGVPLGGTRSGESGVSVSLRSQSDRLTSMRLIQVLEEPPGDVETAHDARTVFDALTAKYDISR